jgi:integrase
MRAPCRGRIEDSYLWRKLETEFGHRDPASLAPLELAKFRNKAMEKWAPQTVKHLLALLVRLARFGEKYNLAPGIKFHVEYPRFDNRKTEFLSEEELRRLINAVEAYPAEGPRLAIHLALYTGMRRGAILGLKWEDVDMTAWTITIRNLKGGVPGASATIPISAPLGNLLGAATRRGAASLERVLAEGEYVVPGTGGRRTDMNRPWRRIREAAGLPNLRFHALRHHFASTLASSGQVDIYTIQRLLTHATPAMTQRYAHLRDDTLRRAVAVAGEIIKGKG